MPGILWEFYIKLSDIWREWMLLCPLYIEWQRLRRYCWRPRTSRRVDGVSVSASRAVKPRTL